ncbi:hypothetical protein B0H14DRAFT_2650489 [Mycena olivaceomarginata]|nr:hypothetical protein B0H14DRAFT_2650489 [Mycena olivaceomarginata]
MRLCLNSLLHFMRPFSGSAAFASSLVHLELQLNENHIILRSVVDYIYAFPLLESLKIWGIPEEITPLLPKSATLPPKLQTMCAGHPLVANWILGLHPIPKQIATLGLIHFGRLWCRWPEINRYLDSAAAEEAIESSVFHGGEPGYESGPNLHRLVSLKHLVIKDLHTSAPSSLLAVLARLIDEALADTTVWPRLLKVTLTAGDDNPGDIDPFPREDYSTNLEYFLGVLAFDARLEFPIATALRKHLPQCDKRAILSIVAIPAPPPQHVQNPRPFILTQNSHGHNEDPGTENFTINGGTFNIQNQENSSQSDESDFRVIRFGDLNLLEEVGKQNVIEYRHVRHKKTGFVKRRILAIVGVRKIHRARIIGMQELFTAAKAQAERHEEFRHPSLIQLFGITSSTRGPRALIYNDGFMSIHEVRKIHKHSPLASNHVDYEMAALEHWLEATGTWLYPYEPSTLANILETNTMLWIRISSGQLCIEVNDAQERDHNFNLNFVGRGGSLSVNVSLMSGTHLEQSLLSHLALDDLYHILSYQSWWQSSEISDPGTVSLGSLSWCDSTSSDDFDPFSAFSLSNRLMVSDVAVRCWKYSYTPLDSSFPSVDDGYQGDVLLPSGWTRVAMAYLPRIEEGRAQHLFTKTVLLKWDMASDICKGWLSQANHVQESCINADIISAIQLRISLWPYVDEFTLRGTFMADAPADDLYLFLFSPDVDDSDDSLTVHLPPEGETFYLVIRSAGSCIIRQFHLAKGFGPTSQDVAIELGYPLVDVEKLNTAISTDKMEVVNDVEEPEV